RWLEIFSRDWSSDVWSSDLVLVAVGQYDRREVVSVFFKKIKIGDRNIYPKRRLFGKAHAGVDDDHLIAISDAHAVHSEFADAAQIARASCRSREEMM